MIAESTLTSKNQTTLPKAVVEILHVKPADKLVFEIHDGKITLSARTGRLADLAGAFRHFGKRPRKTPAEGEMHAAVRRAAARAHLRSTNASPGRRPSRA
jgi:antitoxin PrlF